MWSLESWCTRTYKWKISNAEVRSINNIEIAILCANKSDSCVRGCIDKDRCDKGLVDGNRVTGTLAHTVRQMDGQINAALDKEREMSQADGQAVRKEGADAVQSNDTTSYSLKMCRRSGLTSLWHSLPKKVWHSRLQKSCVLNIMLNYITFHRYFNPKRWRVLNFLRGCENESKILFYACWVFAALLSLMRSAKLFQAAADSPGSVRGCLDSFKLEIPSFSGVIDVSVVCLMSGLDTNCHSFHPDCSCPVCPGQRSKLLHK